MEDKLKKKYQITIEVVEPYKIMNSRVEGDDGKIYRSSYNVPEGVSYKEVSYETGEIGETKKEIYKQEVENLDMVKVIDAVNKK